MHKKFTDCVEQLHMTVYVMIALVSQLHVYSVAFTSFFKYVLTAGEFQR